MRKALAPYWLVLPGGLWLGVFFVIPMVVMVSVSLQTGDLVHGFQQTFAFDHYTEVISQYHVQLLRSLWYGLVTTVLTIALAYPMAYWIAFYGGRHKSTYLFLILLPFFVTFVIRTIAWQFLLADDGIILGHLKSWGWSPSASTCSRPAMPWWAAWSTTSCRSWCCRSTSPSSGSTAS